MAHLDCDATNVISVFCTLATGKWDNASVSRKLFNDAVLTDMLKIMQLQVNLK
jgi:hypothetical protein